MSDLIFIYEKGQVAFLELKTEKGILSDAQLGIQYRLGQLGHKYAVARNIDQALTQLDMWGLLKPVVTPNTIKAELIAQYRKTRFK